MHDTTNIEIILCAVIINNGKTLLCQPLDKSYYYLPGGHLEKGEKLEDCLKRELKEEADVEVKSMKFLDLKEHFYNEHHEINLIYQVELTTKSPKNIVCQEDHFVFTWVELDKINSIKLLPLNVKELLIKYLNKI